MVRCRKEFRLEDGMRSQGPVQIFWGRRDIHDPLECPLLEAVTVYHLRHLDNLECRGAARRFAAECDPVGKIEKIVQLIVSNMWSRQRRWWILDVRAHLALPTVGAEQTKAFSPEIQSCLASPKFELPGPW